MFPFALVFRHYFWSSRFFAAFLSKELLPPSCPSSSPALSLSLHLRNCALLSLHYIFLFFLALSGPFINFSPLFALYFTFFPRPSVFPFPCLFYCFFLSLFPLKQRDFSFHFLSISFSVLPPPSLLRLYFYLLSFLENLFFFLFFPAHSTSCISFLTPLSAFLSVCFNSCVQFLPSICLFPSFLFHSVSLLHIAHLLSLYRHLTLLFSFSILPSFLLPSTFSCNARRSFPFCLPPSLLFSTVSPGDEQKQWNTLLTPLSQFFNHLFPFLLIS